MTRRRADTSLEAPMKKKPSSRPKKSRKSSSRQTRRSGAQRPALLKVLEQAVTALRRDVAVTVSSANAVRAAADAIATVSTERSKELMIRALLDDEVLGLLYSLPATQATSTALQVHSRWLRNHLALEPVYEPGQVLDVRAAELPAFDLMKGVTAPSTGRCTIHVVASGWKRNDRLLRKPVVFVGPS
jgi:hypothetical protein